MREVSLDKSALIGRGYCSDVYAWGEGRVLKLFHNWGPANRAEREFAATKVVYAAGLPVPAAYEMIEVDGRAGILFERIDGPSLLDYSRRRPWTIPWAVRLLTRLHAEIHRLTAPAELEPQRQRIAQRIDAADCSEDEKTVARARLSALPDGCAVCHGDFHPGNILLSSRGPIVIDWSSATRGDSFGDVACTLRLMRFAKLPPWSPGYMHLLLRCLRPFMHRAYLKRYLREQSGSRRQIEAWEFPLAVAAKSWQAPNFA